MFHLCLRFRDEIPERYIVSRHKWSSYRNERTGDEQRYIGEFPDAAAVIAGAEAHCEALGRGGAQLYMSVYRDFPKKVCAISDLEECDRVQEPQDPDDME